jgi:hypothetical protein
MPHVHVKDKATGHEYVVPERLFSTEKHTKTNKPPRDAHGDLVAPKYRTTATAEAAKKKKVAEKSSTPSGQQAETEGN